MTPITAISGAAPDVGARAAGLLGHEPEAHQLTEHPAAGAETHDRLQRGEDDEHAEEDRATSNGRASGWPRRRWRSAPARSPERTASADRRRAPGAPSRGATTRVASCPSGLNVGPLSARARKPTASGTSNQCQPVMSVTSARIATPPATTRAAFSLTGLGKPSTDATAPKVAAHDDNLDQNDQDSGPSARKPPHSLALWDTGRHPRVGGSPSCQHCRHGPASWRWCAPTAVRTLRRCGSTSMVMRSC